ncbi:MAG: HemK2/MTQ2 family protein methyltransferase [Candidatus Aenigmatarchaeota archaeon]
MKLFGFEVELSDEVYVPREDTYLLAEVLENEVDEEDKVLDVGTGCGILAMIAAERSREAVGVDKSEKAVQLARKNASRNDLKNVRFQESDLFAEVGGKFDLIIFNAPYLPPRKDQLKVMEREQWFGGKDGTEIVRKFSREVKDYLSERGRVLLLVSSLTGVDTTAEILEGSCLRSEVTAERKIPWETLYVFKAVKKL